MAEDSGDRDFCRITPGCPFSESVWTRIPPQLELMDPPLYFSIPGTKGFMYLGSHHQTTNHGVHNQPQTLSHCCTSISKSQLSQQCCSYMVQSPEDSLPSQGKASRQQPRLLCCPTPAPVSPHSRGRRESRTCPLCGVATARTVQCRAAPRTAPMELPAKAALPGVKNTCLKFKQAAPNTGRAGPAAPGRGAALQTSIPAPSMSSHHRGFFFQFDQPGKELWEEKTCWSREEQRQKAELKAPSTLHQRNSHSTLSLKAEFAQAPKGIQMNGVSVKQRKSRCAEGCYGRWDRKAAVGAFLDSELRSRRINKGKSPP